MNFSWKPHQLIAHWVPGFIVVAMWILADVHYANLHSDGAHPYTALWLKINAVIGSGFAAVLVVVVPFVVGQFLDAARNWGEDFPDRKPESEVKWRMLKYLTKDELAIFEDYYFMYYVFSGNLWIGLIIGYALPWLLGIFTKDHFWLFTIPTLVGIIIFRRDAHSLRREIKEFLDDKEMDLKKNEKREGQHHASK
jgi:hypothetical protein